MDGVTKKAKKNILSSAGNGWLLYRHLMRVSILTASGAAPVSPEVALLRSQLFSREEEELAALLELLFKANNFICLLTAMA